MPNAESWRWPTAHLWLTQSLAHHWGEKPQAKASHVWMRSRRFAVAAAAFSPFLKKALASKKIWRGGLELGLWMGLGEPRMNTLCIDGHQCITFAA